RAARGQPLHATAAVGAEAEVQRARGALRVDVVAGATRYAATQSVIVQPYHRVGANGRAIVIEGHLAPQIQGMGGRGEIAVTIGDGGRQGKADLATGQHRFLVAVVAVGAGAV